MTNQANKLLLLALHFEKKLISLAQQHGLDTSREELEDVKKSNTLSGLCEIKVNFESADFWVIRKGSQDKVGMPTKEFSNEHIGVKVKDTAVLDPEYLFYFLQALFMREYFKERAKGTLRIKHISLDDLKSIKL